MGQLFIAVRITLQTLQNLKGNYLYFAISPAILSRAPSRRMRLVFISPLFLIKQLSTKGSSRVYRFVNISLISATREWLALLDWCIPVLQPILFPRGSLPNRSDTLRTMER